MKLFSLIETKYQTLTDKFREYLSNDMSERGYNYGNQTVFGQLLTVLTSTVQNIMLYIEDSLIEQNKYTAQRKRSIYGLAAQTGYQPFLGKATGVTLAVSYTPNNEENLNIMLNNRTKLTCTQNGLIYNIILPQEVIYMNPSKDSSAKYVYAVQGKFETQTFVATGGSYYTINMNFVGNLDTEFIDITVNDVKWEYAESLYDMNPEGKQWTYKISPVSGIDFIFGNGEFGKSLKNKDVVKITYLVHDGELGNVDVNQETYFVFAEDLVDTMGNNVDGNNVLNVTFATQDAVVAGSNSESIHQVRQMIGNNSRAIVLSSPTHYKAFINKFSFCGYNRTWSEPGSLAINSLIIKNYKMSMSGGKDYFNLREKDFYLTDAQKNSIRNCLENTGCQIAGSTYNIVDPILCKYALYVTIKMKDTSYNKDYITDQIRTYIGEFFSNVPSDTYIPKSDIVYLLKSRISNIDGIDVQFLSERNETAQSLGYYIDETPILDAYTGVYITQTNKVGVPAGENPNLGLDEFGNILLKNDHYFPVLMGGWNFNINDSYIEDNDILYEDTQTVAITDPLTIIFK